MQLEHFAKALSASFHGGIALRAPSTWEEAFGELVKSIESLPPDGKPVTVFFDEAPWLDSRRSGFLDALEYFWNSQGTRIPRLKLFVCGSAASWIVHKIVQGKGGWHRRVTDLIRVPQFKLHEVSAYLAHQHIVLSRLDVVPPIARISSPRELSRDGPDARQPAHEATEPAITLQIHC